MYSRIPLQEISRPGPNVARWDIPDSDRELLLDSGLPRGVGHLIRASVQEEAEPALDLPGIGPAYRVASLVWSSRQPPTPYAHFGVQRHSGKVYLGYKDDPWSPGEGAADFRSDVEFVNSSVSCFLRFLHGTALAFAADHGGAICLDRPPDDYAADDEAVWRAYLASLKRLRELDPPAFADIGNFWADKYYGIWQESGSPLEDGEAPFTF
jgi:hypothetical protein